MAKMEVDACLPATHGKNEFPVAITAALKSPETEQLLDFRTESSLINRPKSYVHVATCLGHVAYPHINNLLITLT